jgi:hypothetical protein
MSDLVIYLIYGYRCKNLDKIIIINNLYQSLHNFDIIIPVENIKFRCPNTFPAVKDIVQTYVGYCPRPNTTFVGNLMKEVVDDIRKTEVKKVMVSGFSYGGSIANKLAERMNKELTEKHLSKDQLTKLQIATFGSIYFAPMKNIGPINIFNYISISDVAFVCNHYGEKRMKLEQMTKKVNYKGDMILRLQGEPPTTDNVIQLCLYKDSRPLCRDSSPSILNWDEHVYYELFCRYLLMEGTNNIFNAGENGFLTIQDENVKEEPIVVDIPPVKTKSVKTGKGTLSQLKLRKSRKNRMNEKQLRNKSRRKT